MNYAVCNISGKQCILKKDARVNIDLIKKGTEGQFFLLNKVLFCKRGDSAQIGRPFLGQGKVLAQLVQTISGDKITILKTRPKKKYTRIRGHRQRFSQIKIL